MERWFKCLTKRCLPIKCVKRIPFHQCRQSALGLQEAHRNRLPILWLDAFRDLGKRQKVNFQMRQLTYKCTLPCASTMAAPSFTSGFPITCKLNKLVNQCKQHGFVWYTNETSEFLLGLVPQFKSQTERGSKWEFGDEEVQRFVPFDTLIVLGRNRGDIGERKAIG